MGYDDAGMIDQDDTINWDTEGEVPAQGEYDVEFTKGEVGNTKAGKLMVKAQFKIIGAYQADEGNQAAIGKMLFENFVFAAGAAFRVKDFAKATNTVESLPTQLSKQNLEDWIAAMLNTQLSCGVGHRQFEGRTMANIKAFFGHGQVPGLEAAAEEGEEVAAQETQEEEPAQEVQEEAPKQSLRAAIDQRKANGTNGAAKNGAAKPAKAAEPPKKGTPAKTARR